MSASKQDAQTYIAMARVALSGAAEALADDDVEQATVLAGFAKATLALAWQRRIRAQRRSRAKRVPVAGKKR